MNRNRKLVIALTFVLILASVALVSFAMQPSARDLLVASLTAVDEITDGHAIVAIEADMPDQSVNGTAEVWGKLAVGPNEEPAFRIEILEASEAGMVGKTAVSDGTQIWLWDATENVVYTGTHEELAAMMVQQMEDKDWEAMADEAGYAIPADREKNVEDMPQTAEEAIDKLLEYATAERMGSETLNGTDAVALRLIPIAEMMPDEVRATGGLLNVWLRAGDNAPLAVELAGNSIGYGKATATQLEINQGLDNAIFTFDIPEGAKVVRIVDMEMPEHEEKTAVSPDFTPLAATELPEGATFMEQSTIRGAIVDRYSLPDGRSFMVAQSAVDIDLPFGEGETETAVRGVTATINADEEGGRAILSWSENGINFWVGGDITADDALMVAESLK